MKFGKLNPQGKIEFPGFQEILDFTSAGSESSVSVAVDGDTDKEYIALIRNLISDKKIGFQFNGDTGNNYGYQFVTNSAGSISAARNVTSKTDINTDYLGMHIWHILTPTGFIKTMFGRIIYYTSGTTVEQYSLNGWSWNNTANVTSIAFSPTSGDFTADTRVTVYARRSQ